MELLQELLPLPDKELRQKIVNTFNPIEYNKNLEHLKRWFEDETLIVCDSNYENQLNVFLRGSKNDVSKAKKRMKNFFVYKEKFPEYYAFHDLSGKYEEFKKFHVLCQPNVTSDGYRVVFLGFSSPNSEDFDIDILFKSMWMIDHLGMCLVNHYFLGIIVVMDLANASTKHALKILCWTFRRYMKLSNDVLPYRMHKLFMINVPSYIEKFISIGKTFLSEKLRSRFHIEQSDSEMRKYVPDYLIPCDYDGGKGESIDKQCAKWFKLINELRPWFEAEQLVRLQLHSKRNARANAKTTRQIEQGQSFNEELEFQFPTQNNEKVEIKSPKKGKQPLENKEKDEEQVGLMEQFNLGRLEID